MFFVIIIFFFMFVCLFFLRFQIGLEPWVGLQQNFGVQWLGVGMLHIEPRFYAFKMTDWAVLLATKDSNQHYVSQDSQVTTGCMY